MCVRALSLSIFRSCRAHLPSPGSLSAFRFLAPLLASSVYLPFFVLFSIRTLSLSFCLKHITITYCVSLAPSLAYSFILSLSLARSLAFGLTFLRSHCHPLCSSLFSRFFGSQQALNFSLSLSRYHCLARSGLLVLLLACSLLSTWHLP